MHFTPLNYDVRRSLVAIVIAAVCATPAGLTQRTVAQSRDTELEREKATVTRLEEEWLNALNSANVNAIAEVLADDFVRPAPDYGHFVTKADLLSFYRSHLTPQGSDHRRIEDMTVTVYGSTALARGLLTTTNSEGHIIRRLLFTDAFVKREGKWQAVSAQENAVPTPVTPAH
jgi:ketosteroid isomerase-like protein